MNPVSWWHDLQGGKIAEERPPPPGADQPYPNLATVPPKPAAPDRAALANIASALIADRTNAQHVAAAAPIADPSVPSASPALFGRGTVPPPPPAAAIWDCDRRAPPWRRPRHRLPRPRRLAQPSHRKPDGGTAGQGAGRCGAERAACSARCRRHSRPAVAGSGATSLANRPAGAAQSAGRSAARRASSASAGGITWTWMDSRAASAGHCHERSPRQRRRRRLRAKQAGPANAVSVTFVTGSAALPPSAADSAEATRRAARERHRSRSPATAMPPRTIRTPSPPRSLSVCRAPRRWPRR